MSPPSAVVTDPARLQVLRRTGLLDTEGEEAFDRLTRLAARVLNAPIALVSLVDEDRQFFKSRVGLPLLETPLSHSFCQHAVISREPLIIPDARVHPIVRENLAIPDLNIIAYAGIPLITSDGFALGSFCVIDHKPRNWTEGDVAILKDLAAAAMTEIELRTRTAQAEAAVRLRDEVLAVVSHDLRNPLSTIVMSTSLLLANEMPSDKHEQQLQIVQRSAFTMSRLIDDLLDVARIDAGRLAVAAAPEKLGLIIDGAIELVAARTSEKHLRIERSVQADADRVMADRDRVLQVLSNLLGNATKFTPAEGCIMIDAVRDGSWVHVSVRDTGTGISRDELPHIFERFWQAKRAARGSAGLGLAIAKGIVEAHGGRITVDSEPGVGTTFTFSLAAAT